MGNSLMWFVLAAEDLPSFGVTFETIRPILFWVGLTIFGIFGVIFPVLMFVTALLEKQHLRRLVLASEEDQRQRKVPSAVEAAIAMDYRPLGMYAPDNGGKKKKKKWVFMLLSGDGLVLLAVRSAKKYSAMTRLHSGHWLVTADTFPVRDLSGMEWQEMMPDASLSLVLQYHRQRIGLAGQPCVPFSGEGAMVDLFEHERQCTAQLKELGLARYVGTGQETWVYTIRGAFKMAAQVAQVMRMIREGRKRVESLKKHSAPLALKR